MLRAAAGFLGLDRAQLRAQLAGTSLAALVALAELEPGRPAEIVRLAEHDGELLHSFYDDGLVPGTPVEVVRGPSSAGDLRVAIAGSERPLEERAALGIYVRAA